AALFATAVALSAGTASAQPPAGGSPGAGAAAAADSTLHVGVRAPDSTRVAREPVRETGPAQAPAVDFEEQRKAGDASPAGALLAEPVAERAVTRVVPGEGRRERRAKSALYYGNGDAGILDTGARFVSPVLGKGIGGSYARHESDGISPLHHAVSTRYALA